MAAKSENGFSLVETLAALIVFSVVTLGIVPVLLTSIRGSNITRSYTAGKNVALQAMERVRGLPFYIDRATQPGSVDVLDLYIPNLTSYSGGTCRGFFTTAVSCASTGYRVRATPTPETPGYLTTCPGNGAPYCPAGIPAGYSVTYQAWFIQEETASDTDPETYNRVPICAAGVTGGCVPSTYNSATVANDLPSKLLIEMIVTVRWTLEGRARFYDLRTIMGDRQFGDLQVKANATINYSVSGVAGYQEPGAGNKSEVTATGGFAESRVESRRTSTADTTVRAAQFRLVNANATPNPCILAPPGCPGDEIVTPVTGVQSTLFAPPDVPNPGPVNAGFVKLTHPAGSLGDLAGADNTSIGNTPHRATVTGGTPVAEGNFSFVNGPNPHFWLDNNRDDANAFDFQSGGSVRLFSVNPRGASNNITGSTSVVTGAIGSGVRATATTTLNEIRLFPTNAIRRIDSTYGGAVVVIDPFTATVDCRATTNGTAITPTATYSATLRYWLDPLENDVEQGSYVTVPLGTSSTENLATRISNNLLVIDSNNDTRDVYLFPRNNRENFLETWSNVTTVTPVVASQGRQVSVAIEPAITLETTDIQRGSGGGQVVDTSFGISIGALGCAAEDRR